MLGLSRFRRERCRRLRASSSEVRDGEEEVVEMALEDGSIRRGCWKKVSEDAMVAVCPWGGVVVVRLNVFVARGQCNWALVWRRDVFEG